jgi:DNA primase
MEEWPLSLTELYAAKALLYPKMSFLDVVRRCSRQVTFIGESNFTHVCTCPFHADGEERTPSLKFSEKTKKFRCFACDVYGDIFHFIGLVEGRSWQPVVQAMLRNSDIQESQIELAEFEMNTVRYDIVYEINFDLSLTFRDYLQSFIGHPAYDEEKQWTDQMFVKIDERFRNMEDSQMEEAKAFRMQTCVELERRKLLVARKYESSKAGGSR